MASFKALCLAGVASLAVTAAAHAADLLPPPPAPIEQPIYAPPAAIVGGGWYLRGDVGVGIADLRQTDSTFATPVPGFRVNESSLEDSGFIDAGVGYRINQYFRADITGEYRGSQHFEATESYAVPPKACAPLKCVINRGYDKYTGQFQSIAGLVNGYFDAGTWYGVTPWAGAGVGFARVGVRNVTDTGVVSNPFPGVGAAGPGGFGTSGSNYQTNFAFALMAGLDFAVTQNLKLEIGYRYLDMGKVQSPVINCVTPGGCPRETQHFRLASNDIRVGFRYTFEDIVPLAGPSFPLVRKY